MTLKRLFLSGLTLVMVFLLGSSLWSSFGEPQVTNLLELYQTDLLLHATAPQGAAADTAELAQIRKAVLGEAPLKTALKQYQDVRKTAAEDFATLEAKLGLPLSTDAAATSAEGSLNRAEIEDLRLRRSQTLEEQRSLLQRLDLRIGILQAQSGDTKTAIETWSTLTEPPYRKTAAVLTGLWSDPPRILPDADVILDQNLQGWFRYVELSRLYELQQRTDALEALQEKEGAIAQNTLFKLALVGTVPVIGSFLGLGLLIFLITQRFLGGKQSILATHENVPWETPWDWETVWQVLIVGFFFAGQIAVPLVVQLLHLNFGSFGTRAKAISALTYYLLMAASGITVMLLSIKKHRPLPEGWFRFKPGFTWILWGVGGYLAALPLMIGVSLVNQQLWQGQGGSNPLLQIVLEEGDPVALGIFFFTAAIAAPVFEETLFRGFLLPSLTRYFPVWGAIALSSLLFAVAHLSFSEIIPLTTLGAVLGVVYTRSRNLLAPMLMHSLWNSITMIGLFLLGSGAK